MRLITFVLIILILIISGCSKGIIVDKSCNNSDFNEVDKYTIGITRHTANYNLDFEIKKTCEIKTCSKCKEYLNANAERFYLEWYEQGSKDNEPLQNTEPKEEFKETESYLNCINKTTIEENQLQSNLGYAYGQVIIAFEDEVTEELMYNFINNTGFEFNVGVSGDWGVIMVPVVEEIEWICRFEENETIKYAEFNGFSTTA